MNSKYCIENFLGSVDLTNLAYRRSSGIKKSLFGATSNKFNFFVDLEIYEQEIDYDDILFELSDKLKGEVSFKTEMNWDDDPTAEITKIYTDNFISKIDMSTMPFTGPVCKSGHSKNITCFLFLWALTRNGIMVITPHSWLRAFGRLFRSLELIRKKVRDIGDDDEPYYHVMYDFRNFTISTESPNLDEAHSNIARRLCYEVFNNAEHDSTYKRVLNVISYDSITKLKFRDVDDYDNQLINWVDNNREIILLPTVYKDDIREIRISKVIDIIKELGLTIDDIIKPVDVDDAGDIVCYEVELCDPTVVSEKDCVMRYVEKRSLALEPFDINVIDMIDIYNMTESVACHWSSVYIRSFQLINKKNASVSMVEYMEGDKKVCKCFLRTLDDTQTIEGVGNSKFQAKERASLDACRLARQSGYLRIDYAPLVAEICAWKGVRKPHYSAKHVNKRIVCFADFKGRQIGPYTINANWQHVNFLAKIVYDRLLLDKYGIGSRE